MTGMFDQQTTCRAGISEAGMGLTASWPPVCPAHPRQRPAQAGGSHYSWLGLEPLTDGIYAPGGTAW